MTSLPITREKAWELVRKYNSDEKDLSHYLESGAVMRELAKKLGEDEVLTLSNAIQKIVSEVTKIEDVFVYADSSKIKVKIAPIEIFIQMSAHKISDADKIIGEIKSKLSDWKKKAVFRHPINLTLIPMSWKIEIGI